MIPTEMQRLTKYPLLLQSIGQNTEEPAEREKVELAAECCREILHHVNQAVRDMEDLLVSWDRPYGGEGTCTWLRGQCPGVSWPLVSSSQDFWRSDMDLSLSPGSWPCFTAYPSTSESLRVSPCAWFSSL